MPWTINGKVYDYFLTPYRLKQTARREKEKLLTKRLSQGVFCKED